MLAAYGGSHPCGSGEFIPSLTCRLSQKLPIIPSKYMVMANELEQGAVIGAI
jgi:hypothetical protein